jgi:catechol 2,3-dioxygenase-like lactoylglutathione lyase family enzyme
VANELTVPALPCRSIDEIEAFYTALGFTRTYRRVRPNPYLALRWEDIELHFFGIPDFDPQDSYGTCLVFVPDIGSTFRAFAEGMWGVYGKLLVSGIPRMTRPRNRKNAGGLTGFTVVDPGGNWIRFSVRESKDLGERKAWSRPRPPPASSSQPWRTPWSSATPTATTGRPPRFWTARWPELRTRRRWTWSRRSCIGPSSRCGCPSGSG